MNQLETIAHRLLRSPKAVVSLNAQMRQLHEMGLVRPYVTRGAVRRSNLRGFSRPYGKTWRSDRGFVEKVIAEHAGRVPPPFDPRRYYRETEAERLLLSAQRNRA